MTSRNAQCPCGSGQRFKHCCGGHSSESRTADLNEDIYDENGNFLEKFRGVAMRRFCPEPPGALTMSKAVAPPGIMVIEGFLGQQFCDDFCQYISEQDTRRLGVVDSDEFDRTGKVTYEHHAARITETIDLKHRKTDMLREVVRGYRDYATRFFAADLDTIENPSVLKYTAGGRYDPHADSEHWNLEESTWVRSLERDYSLLLYLNEGYEGGTLYFPNFKWRIKPRRGMLVSFPSDHRYLHGAEPLTSGTRFAVASWAKAKISPIFDPYKTHQ